LAEHGSLSPFGHLRVVMSNQTGQSRSRVLLTA
jgi:hypothetical protein